jgi:hypothetical protein
MKNIQETRHYQITGTVNQKQNKEPLTFFICHSQSNPLLQ